ncbi:Glycine/D-amino acid oxidase [Saccharopolyspora antimicrobica]|uniref:Glycine/D-amino acid oxidase n=1 Tax=Saccharopolyspora antimicrobica TaxID=455193 RepID=A0A1I4WUU0_9PSEU|nr:glycine/D-amino acid oxidase-like deaminating enzyme [Saccharopolyspora antimicrobica]SFN16936.1 Glycine/D-amino acid oxidase [Saccharopolyspora antimicrobica]
MPISATGNTSVPATDQAFDVIVIGNGALGLSLGLVLARRGTKVAVVGEARRPWAASAAAGAMNGCFGEVTPDLMASAHGRAKLAMDVRATEMWNSWEQLLVEESDETAIRSAHGTVVILNSIGVPQIDNGGYTAIRQALDEYKEPYEDLDPEAIDWLEPAPTSRPLQAMFIPGEHAVNPPALLRALATAFSRAGGVLVDELITELRISGDRIDGVSLASGAALSAPDVVVAAGANSHNLLSALPAELRNRIPGMVAGNGVSLLVETEGGSTPRSVIRTPNRSFACGLHVVPRAQGQIYLGATNVVSPKMRTTAAIDELNLLLACTRQLRTDLVSGRIEQIQVGNRPVPLDGFPLLGEAGVAGLWLMTGTYRDGLHQSPMLAHEFAARLLGEPYNTELDVFTPVRNPIEAMSREQTVETAVIHTLATGYEFNWVVPDDWPPLIEEQLRDMFSKLLDEIDPEFTPPPEMLASMEPEIHDALRTYYAACRAAS